MPNWLPQHTEGNGHKNEHKDDERSDPQPATARVQWRYVIQGFGVDPAKEKEQYNPNTPGEGVVDEKRDQS